MRCPKCGKEMQNIIHYEKGRSYQFNQCKCMTKTHVKRIHYNEPDEKLELDERKEVTHE